MTNDELRAAVKAQLDQLVCTRLIGGPKGLDELQQLFQDY